MELLVLPCSGGKFPTQLEIMRQLCLAGYRADLTLATSGGNSVAYTISASSWDPRKIELIARKMHNGILLSHWHSTSFVSFIIGYFRGSIYNQGKDALPFFKEMFPRNDAVKDEIWTGIYNITRMKTRVCCNRSEDQSILDSTKLDKDMTQSLDPLYCCGDLSMISKISLASASIPGLIPSQVIEGENYVDGAVSVVSPLRTIREMILDRVINKDNGLHIIYVSPSDLSRKKCKREISTIIDNVIDTAEGLIHSDKALDRVAAYEMITHFSNDVRKVCFQFNSENIKRIMTMRKYCKYTLLEIYPNHRVELPIMAFDGNDVLKAMNFVKGGCSCRFWYARDHLSRYVILPSSISLSSSSLLLPTTSSPFPHHHHTMVGESLSIKKKKKKRTSGRKEDQKGEIEEEVDELLRDAECDYR